MAQTSITGIKPDELFDQLNQHMWSGTELNTRIPVKLVVGGFTINELMIESDGKRLTVTGHLPGEMAAKARARK